MQIHELNSKSPGASDVLAMDDGSNTFKTAAANLVPAYTSGDSSSPTTWTTVTTLTSGLSLATLFNRVSTMIKNVRYIWSKIGTTSMGTTATTITGAIAEHESDISTLNGKTNFSTVSVIGTAKTIAANGTEWISVPFPTSGTAIAVVGYYLNGGTACSVYAFYLGSSNAQFALRNYYSSALTITITAYFLCID